MFTNSIASTVSATGVPASADTLSEFVHLTSRACYSIANGDCDFIATPDIETTMKMVESFGLESGISGGLLTAVTRS